MNPNTVASALPALCALCVGLASERAATQLLDEQGNALTFKDAGYASGYRRDPVVQEVADHAWKGGRVKHAAWGILPMLAATQVGGTYTCGMHVGALLDREIARRFGFQV